ncbi:1-hydroxycarotenoid 3,4-desaturase CrtD [Algihabitans albus]|uniref:1-hydroxycarotenoid 3,4-desaturase CrtD n=1 Tax=Algihabitans albus TaxID=2164067 RepID=UPI000E5C6ED8|nr:1-hydroxycarotenoid 3,4-desaturase CrtD [Algihabitans albus]
MPIPDPAAAERVVVIGAGIGGLAAAITAAARGLQVTLVERAETPGGKMREVAAGGALLDAGPTVFTMKWVFDALFAEAGTSLEDHLELERAETLARHGWTDGSRLDLFADPACNDDAIGAFAGASEVPRFQAFRQDARRIFETLKDSYIAAQRPGPLELTRRAGIPDLTAIKPFASLWSALGGYFQDPRLRQLFARYATYCGSSPFDAPATLMLVAHVELEGLWRIRGGMHRLARAMSSLASDCGAQVIYGCEAAEILVERGRTSGVRLANGEVLPAESVIFNGDAAALSTGLLGRAAGRAVPGMPVDKRSLSAIVWTLLGRPAGFPLQHHNVFFSDAYRAEFDAVFRQDRLPDEPTVYLCAQDRDEDDRGEDRSRPDGDERLYLLVNAPPRGDRHPLNSEEIEQCAERAFALLRRCGLEIEPRPDTMQATTPNDFHRLFPATGGALYGRASHGWTASFQRAGARSKLPGLYLAGGSVHPGPGVPMAALSGRLAVERLLADSTSRRRSFRAGIAGGIWTRSATTGATD